MKDNLTFELLGKCFLDQRPVPTIEMKQFASIVLRDGLVELDRIEKQIAEDEATMKRAMKRARRHQQTKQSFKNLKLCFVCKLYFKII